MQGVQNKEGQEVGGRKERTCTELRCVSGILLGIFTDIMSFNPHMNDMRKVLSSTFYMERNRLTEVKRLA